jgi:hypothetical protein
MWNTDEIVFKSYSDRSPNFRKHVYTRAFWHWLLTGTTSGRPTYTSYSLRRWRWLYDDECTSKLLRTADRTPVAGIPMRKRGADSLRTAAGQVPDTVCIIIAQSVIPVSGRRRSRAPAPYTRKSRLSRHCRRFHSKQLAPYRVRHQYVGVAIAVITISDVRVVACARTDMTAAVRQWVRHAAI